MLKVQNFSIFANDGEKKLLDKVDFVVERNEIHCVLGKNGSGKSTLAYGLLGLDRFGKTEGKIIFNGKDISQKKTHQRAKLGITLAFQEPARFEGLTVADFLRAGKKNLVENEIKKALELVGLAEDFASRKLDEKLSGGERKRIELASVICMKPKLMILDEPDASLDIIVYSELYDLLLKIKKELRCSILLITHREEAGLIAEGATLLEKGKVVATGRFRHVMREYCKREGRRDACLAFKRRNLKP